MQGYEQDLDEQAGYDDYYSDEDGYEDEEEEEERQPPKEELEYLELRQKLKDSIRKNMGKGTSNAQSSQGRRKKLPYNDFGSFFGPSRPVISSRVIQESKSLLENEIRTAGVPSSTQNKKRAAPPSTSATRNVSHDKRPKVVNEVRRKVETLKDTRDYSFLLSDDAELPLPKKESLSRTASFPNSESRSARPKQSPGINARVPRDDKRPVSANGLSRPAASSSQLQNSRPAASASHLRSVSGRPVSSGSQIQNSRPASSGSSHMQQRVASSGSQRPGSSTNRQIPTRPPGAAVNGQSANRNGQLYSRSDSQRSGPAKLPLDQHRKQMNSNNNGVGPGRSASTGRPLPSKSSLERRPSISAGKSSLQSAQRPSSSRPMSSDPRQRVVDQRKVSRDPATSRMIPKQSVPTSRHQMMSRPPLKRPASRDIDDGRRPPKKKKPVRVSEDDRALDMIRKMFRTERFAGREDDDRNMEANYDDIVKEERRSARIAREEDEKEALLIEEEERRERLRKSRKLSR